MNRATTIFLRTLIALAFLATVTPLRAQPDSVFTRTEAMIPMRDGVRLHTQVYAPARAAERLPILFLRTPYGIDNSSPAQLAAALPELWADGYVIVRQDIRGRFKSEGQFVMLRQPRDRKDKQAIDESTDAYDTIEWLLRNTPNNGRVGMAGTSYGAWLTVMGMLDPHPALKAVVPQASPADMWIGDDFHHNGAFRLSYGLEYTYMMESSKEISDVSSIIDRYDAYEWYLGLGPLSNVDAKYFKRRLPTWNDFVNHPDYDAFWKRQGFAPWLNRVTVPTLNVAGWWDQEDFYGPIKIYELLERHDSANKNFLVVGPWNHGGWSNGEGRKLGRIDFGSARGKLSFEPPAANARPAFDSYISDPANPVPYRPRPIQLNSGWGTWQIEDQRFAGNRPDVVTWVTEPLMDDVTVSGKIVANLFASTTGTDSDWIVKFIDVYPENYTADPTMSGYQLMIAGDVFRGRYQKSFEKPEPIAANSVVRYQIGFPANDHVFKRGHRILVQVQSSWFPVIDRNPQRFVPNIFLAKESDFQRATQRVFRSGRHASHIAVPVVEAAQR